jgi:hypothetical protein
MENIFRNGILIKRVFLKELHIISFFFIKSKIDKFILFIFFIKILIIKILVIDYLNIKN